MQSSSPSTTTTGSMYQLRIAAMGGDGSTSSATCNFQERQSSVFDSLASLEAEHKRVTEATKDERRDIRRATWRHVVTAPEDLEAEKERRTADGGTPQKHPKQVFRRPNAPPPPCHRLRGGHHSKRWDPSKWTHYTLADVDEDGLITNTSGDNESQRDPNFVIASAFISELRQRNVDPVETGPPPDPREHRILFRPTRGTKRPRNDPDENLSTSGPTLVAEQEVTVEEGDTLDSDEPHSANSFVSDSNPVFRPRRHRQQIRSRTPEHSDNPASPGEVPALTEESPSPQQLSDPEEDDVQDDIMDHNLA